jgi:hypothetical protein
MAFPLPAAAVRAEIPHPVRLLIVSPSVEPRRDGDGWRRRDRRTALDGGNTISRQGQEGRQGDRNEGFCETYGRSA